jgi:hypothetical protein
MLRLDHKKLAERILTARYTNQIQEELKPTQLEFVKNVLETNEALTDRQIKNLKWLYERKVLGNKKYFRDIQL